MGKRTRLPVIFGSGHGQEYLPMPPYKIPSSLEKFCKNFLRGGDARSEIHLFSQGF
jgi:hypothetical protein